MKGYFVEVVHNGVESIQKVLRALFWSDANHSHMPATSANSEVEEGPTAQDFYESILQLTVHSESVDFILAELNCCPSRPFLKELLSLHNYGLLMTAIRKGQLEIAKLLLSLHDVEQWEHCQRACSNNAAMVTDCPVIADYVQALIDCLHVNNQHATTVEDMFGCVRHHLTLANERISRHLLYDPNIENVYDWLLVLLHQLLLVPQNDGSHDQWIDVLVSHPTLKTLCTQKSKKWRLSLFLTSVQTFKDSHFRGVLSLLHDTPISLDSLPLHGSNEIRELLNDNTLMPMWKTIISKLSPTTSPHAYMRLLQLGNWNIVKYLNTEQSSSKYILLSSIFDEHVNNVINYYKNCDLYKYVTCNKHVTCNEMYNIMLFVLQRMLLMSFNHQITSIVNDEWRMKINALFTIKQSNGESNRFHSNKQVRYMLNLLLQDDVKMLPWSQTLLKPFVNDMLTMIPYTSTSIEIGKGYELRLRFLLFTILIPFDNNDSITVPSYELVEYFNSLVQPGSHKLIPLTLTTIPCEWEVVNIAKSLLKSVLIKSPLHYSPYVLDKVMMFVSIDMYDVLWMKLRNIAKTSNCMKELSYILAMGGYCCNDNHCHVWSCLDCVKCHIKEYEKVLEIMLTRSINELNKPPSLRVCCHVMEDMKVSLSQVLERDTSSTSTACTLHSTEFWVQLLFQHATCYHVNTTTPSILPQGKKYDYNKFFQLILQHYPYVSIVLTDNVYKGYNWNHLINQFLIIERIDILRLFSQYLPSTIYLLQLEVLQDYIKNHSTSKCMMSSNIIIALLSYNDPNLFNLLICLYPRNIHVIDYITKRLQWYYQQHDTKLRERILQDNNYQIGHIFIVILKCLIYTSYRDCNPWCTKPDGFYYCEDNRALLRHLLSSSTTLQMLARTQYRDELIAYAKECDNIAAYNLFVDEDDRIEEPITPRTPRTPMRIVTVAKPSSPLPTPPLPTPSLPSQSLPTPLSDDAGVIESNDDVTMMLVECSDSDDSDDEEDSFLMIEVDEDVKTFPSTTIVRLPSGVSSTTAFDVNPTTATSVAPVNAATTRPSVRSKLSSFMKQCSKSFSR